MKINKFVGPVTRGDVTVAMTEDGKYWDVEAVSTIRHRVWINKEQSSWKALELEYPILVLKRER